MPKKKLPTTKPPTVITITLPDEGHLPRTGQILVQRGMLAIIRQFVYSSLSEISAAIQHAAASLIQLEQNPPEIKPAVATMPPVEPPAASEDASETDLTNPAETEVESLDENTDTPPDSQPSPESLSDQMSLI